MSAQILDGKALALKIKSEIAAKVMKLSRSPGLGTILVGTDPGSLSYVAGKHRDCAEVGIASIRIDLPATASESEILAAVAQLNNDANCTGFIVQLPLPAGVDAQKVLAAVDPKKDADGLHPNNLGKLVLDSKTIVPCTPKAILRLLNEYQINLSGKSVLIIGRGTTVGRPLSILLSQKSVNATVTLAHTATTNLGELLKSADVIIAAIGKAHFIKPQMIKSGAVVIDVGITRIDSQLLGDVDPAITSVAGYFAPMPGGVGPMTRAMLLSNLLELAQA
jgi:methylenetetrahydrofolate dehydrogenase (NADP+) / methenyltetrahydrofolate cyclohydrolase